MITDTYLQLSPQDIVFKKIICEGTPQCSIFLIQKGNWSDYTNVPDCVQGLDKYYIGETPCKHSWLCLYHIVHIGFLVHFSVYLIQIQMQIQNVNIASKANANANANANDNDNNIDNANAHA